MRAVVLGGSGAIGVRVVDLLAKRKLEVVIVSRGTGAAQIGPWDDGGVQWVQGDLRNLVDAKRVIRGADVVVNLAADDGNAEEKRNRGFAMASQNVAIAGNVLFAAREEGVRRVVVASSVKAVRSCDTPAPRDDRVRGPLAAHELEDGYGFSKAVTDQLSLGVAREAEVEVSIVRLGNVFGIKRKDVSRRTVVETWIRAALEGSSGELTTSGETVLELCFVDEAVSSIVRNVFADPAVAVDEVVTWRVCLTCLSRVVETVVSCISREGSIRTGISNVAARTLSLECDVCGGVRSGASAWDHMAKSVYKVLDPSSA